MSFVEIKNLTIDSSMDGINFTAVNNLSISINKGKKVASYSFELKQSLLEQIQEKQFKEV